MGLCEIGSSGVSEAMESRERLIELSARAMAQRERVNERSF